MGHDQFVANADHENVLEGNIRKSNTEALIDASKEVGLEVNTENTKYISLSRHQNSGENRIMKTANRSFENLAKLKYLGATITHQN
jgi:hypothetical protein